MDEQLTRHEEEQALYKEVSERVRSVRKALFLTQKEFGESAGIDRRYVAKVECLAQNPSLYFLRKIAKEHGISLDYIMFGENDMFRKGYEPENDF